MANLRLISLVCKKTEDTCGADEAYLRVAGKTVWGPKSINDGEEAVLESIIKPIHFDQKIRIALYDKDVGGWFDDDDHLGTTYAYANQTGDDVHDSRFTGDGADYTLYYKVLTD